MRDYEREIFRKLNLFSPLSLEEVGTIEAQCRWVSHSDGEEILSLGQINTDIYFLLEGEVQTTIYTSVGRAVHIRRPPKAALLGELALIDGFPSPASVTAVGQCAFAAINGHTFMAMAVRNPVLYKALLAHLASELRILMDQVVEFSTLGARARIHAELLRICRERGSDSGTVTLSPAPTHTRLAARVGTNRETVTREFGRLQEIGLVRRVGNDLVIPDIERFSDAIDDTE
ncbi:Crp/Fnr family transcriptional regulator [Bosea sp. 117]|uniref:Crp/Fnr family transcriptional regulator n=1 Tax=Bosea sp. 117 TaxID=1125973 RepID=UPI0018CC7089|nr:Crp/Fnr family transcriptional regulator [Bosea sp. 117]